MSFTIALVEPKIPPNTGNIARLCAATGAELHLVGELGFDISEKAVKRAGLDYWEHVNVTHFLDVEAYFAELEKKRFFLYSTKAKVPYHKLEHQLGDTLVFGSETQGLAPWILEKYKTQACFLPMPAGAVRSLNLSNTAAIALFEAMRQTGCLSD